MAYTPTDFQTPPEICRYMVSLLPVSAKTVLEPTPGIGNLVQELRNKGFATIAPDCFFDLIMRSEIRYDAIVTNPPFSGKYCFNLPESWDDKGMRVGYRILNECMRMSDFVVALMPWFTLSDSDVRMRTLIEFGLKSVTTLPRKTFQYARYTNVCYSS